MERRTLQSHRPQLIRSTDGKPSKITGYAAVYYNASDPGTEFVMCRYGSFSLVERLMPGCFDRAVREDDVRGYYNHDRSAILGRTKSGTLRLSTDAKGLRYEIDPPDTQLARDLLESLKRGDITGSSFAFDYQETSTVDQRLPDGTEREIIEVRSVILYDVGPVTEPAYASTTSEARAQARKANGGGLGWTPEAMRRHVEKLEADLLDLDRRLARNAPHLSRRSRRERYRERAAQIVADAEYLGTVQAVEDARRMHVAGLARRK